MGETLNLLMSSHFSDSTPTTINDTPHINQLAPHQFEWISVSLYRKAVNKFGLEKAPGPDGLKNYPTTKTQSQSNQQIPSNL